MCNPSYCDGTPSHRTTQLSNSVGVFMIRLQTDVTSKLNSTAEGLRSALQNAIELEHSTIPPYLYALYSLKPGTNKEIAAIIRSVVLEEMLHMALVCNVLNAVGGSPLIDSPK